MSARAFSLVDLRRVTLAEADRIAATQVALVAAGLRQAPHALESERGSSLPWRG
jgi:hypothetical protein